MTTAPWRGRAGVGAIALACSLPVGALGPSAPFAPPRAASAAATEPDATAGTPANLALGNGPTGLNRLAGLRLGPHPLALLDGEWRAPGASVRGARLAQMDTRGITLVHADGRRERLWFSAPPTATGTDPAPKVQRSPLNGNPR